MADYGVIKFNAAPGILGDSSKYNIDGRCYVADDHDGILVGKIVTVKSVSDGYKEITDVFEANTLPYGVAFRSHVETSLDDEGYMQYLPGDPINVVSNGRVWVLTQDIEQPPEFLSPVKVARDGFASINGAEVAGWSYTGNWEKWNTLFNIVEIQINQGAPYIHAGEKVLLRGASLEANLASPQAPNKVVTITLSVAPSNATDKTGEWTVDNEGCIISPISDTQAHLSVADSSSEIDEVHVNWTANDGSKTAAMIEFSFKNPLP